MCSYHQESNIRKTSTSQWAWWIVVVALVVIVSSSCFSQDYGVFVVRDSDNSVLANYKLANAPSLPTNACADTVEGKSELKLYRVIVNQAEYTAGWAALDAAKKLAAKTAAGNERADFDDQFNKLLKAFALVVLDEINNERGWLASFKVEVAASASLADMKTRVAGLPDMPDRTKQQLIDAVKAKYATLP